jgi:ribosomal protein L11 methyltransferase
MRRLPASRIPAPPSLYTVTVESDLSFAAIVETGLEMLGIAMTSWADVLRQRVLFCSYLSSRQEAGRLAQTLRGSLAEWSAGERWRVRVRPLAPRDWSQSWKRHFRPVRAGERVVVVPPWFRPRAKAGDCVVVIEPGLSFGTGQHATTRGCLQFVDLLARQGVHGPFLDLGCGSGILAIAAARLGFAPVVAVDNDPAVPPQARRNCRLNGVEGQVECRWADASGARRAGGYAVVAANLLSEVLAAEAPRVARLLRPAASHLVVSGILAHQYAAVRAAYEACGLRETGQIAEEGWISACLAPRPGAGRRSRRPRAGR